MCRDFDFLRTRLESIRGLVAVIRIALVLVEFCGGVIDCVIVQLLDVIKKSKKLVCMVVVMEMAGEMAHLREDDGKNIVASCGELPLIFGNDAHVQPSCNVASDELDASIWSNTPEGVLYLVFSRLPLKSRFRIRSLSKLWMSTDFFSKETTVGEQRRERFALVKSNSSDCEVWVFDTPAQEWCKFRLGPAFPSSSKFSGAPFAAAGGLLCYISETSEVVVGNPLTHTWRLLPQNHTLNEFPTLTHMSMAGDDQYSITLGKLCDNTGVVVFETYDSISNTWRSASQISSYYYNLFKNGEYRGLATIDTGSRNMKRLMYPSNLQESAFMDRVEEQCWIQQSKGGLCMCSNVPRKEGVWQRLESTHWQRVSLLPKVLQLYEKTALYVSDEVMLLVGSEPRCFAPQFEDADPHRMVVLNNSTQQWSILPTVPSSFGRVDELLRGFMFEPRFDAKP